MPQVVDDDIQEGLDSAVGHHSAKLLMNRDQTLSSAQEKVMRIMGPLGRLGATLDETRMTGDDKMARVKDLLQFAETAVDLTGQASVAIRYARRKEFMGTLMRHKDATRLLKKYDDLCCTEGHLFGAEFQRKISLPQEALSGGASEGGLAGAVRYSVSLCG